MAATSAAHCMEQERDGHWGLQGLCGFGLMKEFNEKKAAPHCPSTLCFLPRSKNISYPRKTLRCTFLPIKRFLRVPTKSIWSNALVQAGMQSPIILGYGVLEWLEFWNGSAHCQKSVFIWWNESAALVPLMCQHQQLRDAGHSSVIHGYNYCFGSICHFFCKIK